MKRLIWILLTLCLLVMPAAAAPYTAEEVDGFMQAMYCEQIWAEEFPDFQAQFIDVDLDGRKELLTMEAGGTYAPKDAYIFAFMDAELSGRGRFLIGKVEVCRDPKTNESFMVNYVDRDGVRVAERLVYDPEEMLISLKPLSDKVSGRLESYGYEPMIVTKSQWDTVKVAEDAYAITLPMYQHDDYTNGTPPMYETPDEGEKSPFPVSTALCIAAVVLIALTPAYIASKRIKAKEKR